MPSTITNFVFMQVWELACGDTEATIVCEDGTEINLVSLDPVHAAVMQAVVNTAEHSCPACRGKDILSSTVHYLR